MSLTIMIKHHLLNRNQLAGNIIALIIEFTLQWNSANATRNKSYSEHFINNKDNNTVCNYMFNNALIPETGLVSGTIMYLSFYSSICFITRDFMSKTIGQSHHESMVWGVPITFLHGGMSGVAWT